MKNLFESKNKVLLLAVACLAVVVPIFWGIMTRRQANAPSSEEELPGNQEIGVNSREDGDAEAKDSLPEGWSSLKGFVYPLDKSIYMQGTHKLEDKDGNLLVLLSSADEKLKLAEGAEVTVQGAVKRTVEGNKRIMQVEVILWKK